MREPDEIIGESYASQPATRPAETVSSRTDVTTVAASWHAPLPPPNLLERYDAILPGAADRILQMSEKQQEHTHNLETTAIGIERTVIVSDARRGYFGMTAGFIISVLVILGGIFLIATGHEWAGSVLVGINLTGLAGVFVYGSKARRDERNRNAENMTE